MKRQKMTKKDQEISRDKQEPEETQRDTKRH